MLWIPVSRQTFYLPWIFAVVLQWLIMQQYELKCCFRAWLSRINHATPFTPLAIYLSRVGEDTASFPVFFQTPTYSSWTFHQKADIYGHLGTATCSLFRPSLHILSRVQGRVYQHENHLSAHAAFGKQQLPTPGMTMSSYFCSFCKCKKQQGNQISILKHCTRWQLLVTLFR